MKFDIESMTMTEIIQLQTLLSQTLQRRFERPLALVFTDVVGSTQYFARFGDEAGRRLVQRHIDLLSEALKTGEGRIVDTAGDGAFTCFPTVDYARAALIDLQKRIMRQNLLYSRDEQLSVRCGLHYGNVLTDGVVVSGDAVNLCARITSAASGGEIRLTRDAFRELSLADRLRCGDLKMVELKGLEKPVGVLSLSWRDAAHYPTHVRIVETNEEFPLPDQDVISFGRLQEWNGMPANDIVLDFDDVQTARLISRWHFELRRQADGFLLLPVSSQATELDGVVVEKGQQKLLRPGMQVRLSRVVTLHFYCEEAAGRVSQETLSVNHSP